MRILSRACEKEINDQSRETGRRRDAKTHLPKKLVDVLVMIRNSFDELVELIHEVTDVDAAERIGLREGESEREAMAMRSKKRSGQRWESKEERGKRGEDALSELVDNFVLDPANTDDSVKLLGIFHLHRLVVVLGHDLEKKSRRVS